MLFLSSPCWSQPCGSCSSFLAARASDAHSDTALDYLVRLYFEVIIGRNDAKALKRIGEGKKGTALKDWGFTQTKCLEF